MKNLPLTWNLYKQSITEALAESTFEILDYQVQNENLDPCKNVKNSGDIVETSKFLSTLKQEVIKNVLKITMKDLKFPIIPR